MPGFGLKILGLKELQKKLKPSTIKKPLGDGVKKIVFTLESEVKKATVVDTGLLRSSITSELIEDGGKVGTNVEYATFVEYGSQKMEARHMEGGRKVLGRGGMFVYGFRQLQEKMGDLLKGIGASIQARWR